MTQSIPTPSFDFYIGTYTLGSKSHSQGVYRCTLAGSTGQISTPECVATLDNPSYISWGNNGQILYAAQEKDQSDSAKVSTFRVLDNGLLSHLKDNDLPGGAPCHLAASGDGKFLATAQYETGDISLFSLKETGVPTAVTHTPAPVGDADPHAHYVQFFDTGQSLAAIDLGQDQLRFYALATQTTPLTLTGQINFPKGSGPRHLARSKKGNIFYVLTERSEEIFVVKQEDHTWHIASKIQAFTSDQNVANGAAAAIRLSDDGKFLYASSRTKSELAVFAVDQETHNLSHVQTLSLEGKEPRDFALSPDGRLLVVANQNSNSLASYWVIKDTGKIVPTGKIVDLDSPVCVLF